MELSIFLENTFEVQWSNKVFICLFISIPVQGYTVNDSLLELDRAEEVYKQIGKSGLLTSRWTFRIGSWRQVILITRYKLSLARGFE